MAINWGLIGDNPDVAGQFARGYSTGMGIREDREQKEKEERAQKLFEVVSNQMANNPNFDITSSTDFNKIQALDPALAEQVVGNYERLSKKRKTEYVTDFTKVADAVRQGDMVNAEKMLVDRLERIDKRGGDASDSMRAYYTLLNNPDEFIAGVDSMMRARYEEGLGGKSAKDRPAGIQEFDYLAKAGELTPEDLRRAARVELGLDPRAVGSSIMTMSEDPETVARVADAEATIVGAKDRAGLIARLELEPRVQAALTEATAFAQAQADAAAENRSNDRALKVYQQAANSLEEALGVTATGTFVGLMPAFTTNQKVADGAASLLRPILKDVVRSAGEGTFTEGDQKIIDDLIPQRTDTPESRALKMQMLDNFIMGKLAPVEVDAPPGNPPEQPSGAQNSLTPEDQQALSWARSNPDDPRSVAIFRRLGMGG